MPVLCFESAQSALLPGVTNDDDDDDDDDDNNNDDDDDDDDDDGARRSQDFLWGCTFLSDKVEDLL